MTRYAKLVLVLAVPACASAQGTDTLAPAPHGQMAGHEAGHAMHAMHGTATPTRIVVNATGTAARAPEQAVVNLAVETSARTAREAAAQNANRMDRVIAAMRRLDIPQERIRTTSYHMYPQYDSRPEPVHGQAREPEIVGYRAMNMLEVTVDGPERAGAVIDAALEAGANRVDNLRFQLRDQQAVRQEALREAVRNARAEAAVLAEAGGLTLGAPVEISTAFGYSPPRPPMPMMRAMDAAEASMPTPVQPGEIEMQASVTVVYSARQ